MSNRLEMFGMYQKRQFDPSNKDDIKIVKTFLSEYKWGGVPCPFHLEWPYVDMPSMLKDKLAKHFLKIS